MEEKMDESAVKNLNIGIGIILVLMTTVILYCIFTVSRGQVQRQTTATAVLEEMAAARKITRESYEKMIADLHIVQDDEYALIRLKSNNQGGYEIIDAETVKNHLYTQGFELLEKGDKLVLRRYYMVTYRYRGTVPKHEDFEIVVP